MIRTRWPALAVLLVALIGCQKNPGAASSGGGKMPPVAGVKESERSRNFVAVHRQLELGGALYGYIDVEDDVLKLAQSLPLMAAEFAKSEPLARSLAEQDYAALARILGLTDIKAVGTSSVADEAGRFRNRVFLYTGGARHGLMAGLGGKPGPFRHLDLAPADATFFGETELDLGVVYRTIKDVIAQVGGEPAGNQFELALKHAGEALALSLVDLIYGLKGRSAIVLRLDPEHTARISGGAPMVVPTPSLLLCVEGVAPIIEAALVRSRGFRRSDTGKLHIYEALQRMPWEGMRPIVVADGATLYCATSREFFDECRGRKGGLARSAEFQRALKHVGNEGNGLTYVSAQLFEQMRRFEKLNPNLPAQMKAMLVLTLMRLPEPAQPMIAVRTNLDDGVLFRSYLNRSIKEDFVGAALYFPLGMAAAVAIPALHKVHSASREKAILDNLRLLAAAAEQHYLETGTRTTTYDELVGPGHYVKSIQPVAGEDYRAIRFVRGEPLRVRLPDGRPLEYKP